MRTWSVWFPITVAVSLAVGASAQQPAAPQAAPVERRDPALDAATRLIGRALILRCFCAENSLAFDAAGQLEQTVKLTDWTLAGVNVLKVERKAAGTIELDGLRVAVRFAPDRREFDRHAMNDEKVKHYFMPKTPWPKDGLEGETIVMPGAPGAPAGLTDPRPIKRSEPTYTTEASHDRVLGTVMVQAVVDAQGEPQRPVIVQPLGYGLDARTVQAVERFHFQPASAGGKSVAAYVEIRQEFTAAP
jgi:TonB family protein